MDSASTFGVISQNVASVPKSQPFHSSVLRIQILVQYYFPCHDYYMQIYHMTTKQNVKKFAQSHKHHISEYMTYTSTLNIHLLHPATTLPGHPFLFTIVVALVIPLLLSALPPSS